MNKLHHSDVRCIADKVNRLRGVNPDGFGSPIIGNGKWVVGAITLENNAYGLWEIGMITNQRGAVRTITRGKLRECKQFLDGMLEGIHYCVTPTEGKKEKADA